MKKVFTLAIALTAIVISSFGQCIPDSAALSPGQYLYPNSLPGILQSSSYSGVLSFLVPDSMPGRVFGNPVVAAFTIAIDSVQINSVSGTPSGISATNTPALGSWIPAKGYSCILFSGTTTAPIGNYPLTVSGVGCGHFTLPVIGTRVDSCISFNYSSAFPYSLQVCDTQCTNTYDTTRVTLCRGDSIQWGSVNVKRSGRYVDTVLQSIGCDSLKILFATFLNPATGRDTIKGCHSVLFNGNSLSHDTTVTILFQGAAVNGCDSSVRIRVLVGGATPTITVSSTLTAVDPAASSWQWLLNGSPISGATSVNYTPTGSTVNSYAVVVTDRYGCVDTSAATLVSGITGVSIPAVRIYPSPNNGSFVLETHDAKGTSYTVTNSLGQIVQHNAISSDKQSVELGNIASGVYTISVKGSEPISFTVSK